MIINVSGTGYFKSQICGIVNKMRSEKWKGQIKEKIYIMNIYCVPGTKIHAREYYSSALGMARGRKTEHLCVPC